MSISKSRLWSEELYLMMRSHFCLVWCLTSKSTAMVVSGRSFHLIQQTHNLKTTPYQRRCDIMTSHRRWRSVVSTSCACLAVPTPFSLASLTKVNQYFVHIFSLVTDNNPSWTSGWEENGRRNCFVINFHECMKPGLDWTRDLWICNRTRICSHTFFENSNTIQYSTIQIY